MSAHTPGPWVVRDGHVYATAHETTVTIPAVDGCPSCGKEPQEERSHNTGLLALVYAPGKAGDFVSEHAANGLLIAASPDMAALLLSAYQHVSHGGPKRGEVEDVLRKAGLIQ